MNTRLNSFFCAAFGLVPAAVVALVSHAAPVQAQSAPNSLAAITSAGTPTNPAPGRVLASQPAGIVKDVEKLMASGADPAVIKAFIQNWPAPYSVTADDILHLHQGGLPSDVLTAFINHAGELAARVHAAAGSHPLPSTAPVNPPAPGAAPTVPMAPTVGAAPTVADSYVAQPTYVVPTYTYPAYPVYDYGYYYPYYYPGISIGFGLGHGYRGHYGYGYRGGYGGHGGFGGHGGGFGGHGGGFGGHGGGFGGHGGGFGGHGGGFGGHGGGGHR